MKLVANARMYSVAPNVASAWKQLFRWVGRSSKIDLEIIDHAYPLPLSELWSRTDLGCAFICGFPFVRSRGRLVPIAAPIPMASPEFARPKYSTLLVAKAKSHFARLEDTFGHRLGYTVEDSHSGYNALRFHLLPFWRSLGRPLFSESVGPLHTPKRVLDAIENDVIDVGPLDNYAYDLMLRNDPGLASRVRIIAHTAAAPIPFLAASAEVPASSIEALRRSFLSFSNDTECADIGEALGLRGFSKVNVEEYATISAWDATAREAGYSLPF